MHKSLKGATIASTENTLFLLRKYDKGGENLHHRRRWILG